MTIYVWSHCYGIFYVHVHVWHINFDCKHSWSSINKLLRYLLHIPHVFEQDVLNVALLHTIGILEQLTPTRVSWQTGGGVVTEWGGRVCPLLLPEKAKNSRIWRSTTTSEIKYRGQLNTENLLLTVRVHVILTSEEQNVFVQIPVSIMCWHW